MSATKPPASARVLAAASHFGLPAFMLLLVLLMETHIVRQPRWVDHVPGWTAGALPVLPFAILWAASRWCPARKFIAAHAGRAAIFQVMCLAAMGSLGVADDAVAGPPVFDVFVAVVMCAWLVLPFGAATRALEGKMGWYPFVARIIPDPPAV